MKRKLGLFSYYGFNTPLKDRLKNIKNIGFDSTMLWWGDKLAFSEMKPEEIITECQMLDLEIKNIHIPFIEVNKIWSGNSFERNQLYQKHINWLDDCHKFKIDMMVMHISKGSSIKKINNYGIQFIQELFKIAKNYNIKIAIENTKNNDLLFEIFENIDSNMLGLCFDSSHAWVNEEKPQTTAATRLCSAQIVFAIAKQFLVPAERYNA